MLNLFFYILMVLLITFICILFLSFFIIEMCHLFELKKIQKTNVKKYKNITPQELSKNIYSSDYISQEILEKNLKTAYEEYRYQNSLLQTKSSFFFTVQSVFGGLFAFLYKYFNLYNNLLSFIPILFGIATILLFSNMENVNNKIANIRCYILKMEQINNQPLMNFFENGFYKQAFDTDGNIFIFFAPYICIAWVLLGVFLLFHADKYLYYILSFTSIAILIFIINVQYKAHKSYGFNDDNKE